MTWNVLNAYAGIGGNRKLWEDVDVTALEHDPAIADIYRDHFPKDEVVVADAHEFMRENFDKFDFIWSSPPCPTHSRIRKIATSVHGKGRQNDPVYPDMELYEEILFLKGYFEERWVVENVVSWYDPLVNPQESNHHYFWANFPIPSVSINGGGRRHNENVGELEEFKGFDLSGYELSNSEKTKILRNAVHPELGKMILDAARSKGRQATLGGMTE